MDEIFFVVPFGRDGAADRAARKFAASLPRTRESSVTIENLPGEGGARGLNRANSRIAAGMPVMLLGTPSTHILLPARFGPRGMPGELQHRLNREINRIMMEPDVKAKMEAIGVEPVNETPERFAQILRADADKWGKLVRELDIKE